MDQNNVKYLAKIWDSEKSITADSLRYKDFFHPLANYLHTHNIFTKLTYPFKSISGAFYIQYSATQTLSLWNYIEGTDFDTPYLSQETMEKLGK